MARFFASVSEKRMMITTARYGRGPRAASGNSRAHLAQGGVFELQVFATNEYHEVGLDDAGLLADRPEHVRRLLPPRGIW